MSRSFSRSNQVLTALLLGAGILAALNYLFNGAEKNADIRESSAEIVDIPASRTEPDASNLSAESSPRDAEAKTVQAAENILITRDGSGIDLSAHEIYLDEVLTRFEQDLSIEIIDLRNSFVPDEEEQALSFSFSGKLEELIRFVMDQYGYNYAISHQPVDSASDLPPVVKLFVYGPGQNAQLDSVTHQGDKLAPASQNTVADKTGEPTLQGRQANIPDLLRSRALGSGQMPPPPPARSSTGPGYDATTSSATGEGDNPDFSYRSEEEKRQAELAEMTRQARQQVEALVEGLKEAEKILQQQTQQ